MQENILNAFAEQAQSFYTPFSKINALFVENIEKTTDLQLKALKSYADLGINQLKKAVEVKDAETARAFTTAQAETLTAINKKLVDDAKVFSDLAVEFKTQVESLVEEARNNATKGADAKPAAAKKSA